jgi:hypothetical protein
MRFPSPIRLGAALGAAVLGFATIAIPAAASAAELDAIDDVAIVAPNPDNPSAPLTVGQEFLLSATWSVSDEAQPGDTFGLDFPSLISVAWDQSFELLDPDGAVVGTCEASGQSVACTLGDYVLDHHDVHGSLSVRTMAAGTTEAEELVFETSTGATVTAPLPGGGIVAEDPSDGPSEVRKFGGIAPDGSSARWAIEVPIEHLERLGEDVVLTDVYDERLDLDAASLSVAYVGPDGWDAWISDREAESIPLSSGEWTFENHPSTHSFDLTFPRPRAAGGWYLVSYSTPFPADVRIGDVFANAVTAAGTTLTENTVEFVDADGNGSGQPRRSIAVTKAVSGDGDVPDVEFTVALDCVDAEETSVRGYPRRSAVRAGESVTFPGIPVGAVCTLSEPEDGGADAVSFSPSSRIPITSGSPAVIELVVTNSFLRTPVETPAPTPTPPVPATPTDSSSTPPPTPAGSTDRLARTGADAVGPISLAALVLVMLGAVGLIAVRRRSTR